jgi:hypothetical protein
MTRRLADHVYIAGSMGGEDLGALSAATLAGAAALVMSLSVSIATWRALRTLAPRVP